LAQGISLFSRGYDKSGKAAVKSLLSNFPEYLITSTGESWAIAWIVTWS
jgi:hypothetical protein